MNSGDASLNGPGTGTTKPDFLRPDRFQSAANNGANEVVEKTCCTEFLLTSAIQGSYQHEIPSNTSETRLGCQIPNPELLPSVLPELKVEVNEAAVA